MTIDGESIFQGLTVLAIAGLVTDHFRLRREVSDLARSALTVEFMKEVRGEFTAIRSELQKVATDLAFIKGQQAGSHPSGD